MTILNSIANRKETWTRLPDLSKEVNAEPPTKTPELPQPQTPENSLENVLVFSSANDIFVLDNLQNSQPVQIASRPNSILALCSHPREYFVKAGVLK